VPHINCKTQEQMRTIGETNELFWRMQRYILCELQPAKVWWLENEIKNEIEFVSMRSI
jgi:hypothetical protein